MITPHNIKYNLYIQTSDNANKTIILCGILALPSVWLVDCVIFDNIFCGIVAIPSVWREYFVIFDNIFCDIVALPSVW